MPSWSIHKKWCKALGIKEEVCQEVNKIIDSSPHDIEDRLLKWEWAREAFESGKIKESFCVVHGDDHEKLTKELAEITNKFGQEGIKATFNHIALDRIAELIQSGFDKEQIRKKLIEYKLMDYVPDYEKVFRDISREVKSAPLRIQKRKEFEKLARSGVYGMFVVDGSLLPPVAALLRMRSKLAKGKSVYVKWDVDAYKARAGRIKRTLYRMDDLWELIREIKQFKKEHD